MDDDGGEICADSEEDECLTMDVAAHIVDDESEAAGTAQFPKHKKMKPYAPHRRPRRPTAGGGVPPRAGSPRRARAAGAPVRAAGGGAAPARARAPRRRDRGDGDPAVAPPRVGPRLVRREAPADAPPREEEAGAPAAEPEPELEPEPEPPVPWVWRPIVMDPELVSALTSGSPTDEDSVRPGFTCGMSNAVLFRPEGAPPSSATIALVVDDTVPSAARFAGAQSIATTHPELLVGRRCVIRDDRGRRNVQVRAYVPSLESFVVGHPNYGVGSDGILSVVDLLQESFTIEPSALPVATMSAATEGLGTFTHECVVCMTTQARRQMADFCFTSYRVGAHDEDRGEPRHTPQICEPCMKMHVQSYLGEGKLAVRCPVEGCGRSLQTRELRHHATPEAYEKLIERLREAEEAHVNADQAAVAAQGAAAGLELRMCPVCGVLIEKNKGCMTMRCYRCDTHFEWAKAQVPNGGAGGTRRRWGPPIPIDEHGAPEPLAYRQSAQLWLRWFTKLSVRVGRVLCILYAIFYSCSWIWSLGWRKVTWGTELIGTLLLLGAIIWKLLRDWKAADPDPRRRRTWTRMERLRHHGRAFRSNITTGWPQDPRRAVEFATLISPLVPTVIKLLWLQRIFFRTEFLHLDDPAAENATEANNVTCRDDSLLLRFPPLATENVTTCDTAALSTAPNDSSVVAAVGDEIVSWWWLIVLVVTFVMVVSFRIYHTTRGLKMEDKRARNAHHKGKGKTSRDGKRKTAAKEAVTGEPARDVGAANDDVEGHAHRAIAESKEARAALRQHE